MAIAKIEIKLGAIDFKGEGEEQWIEGQLDKILQHAPALLKLGNASQDHTNKVGGSGGGGGGNLDSEITLAKFLSEKSAGGNQVKRFLATAVWLHSRGNKKPTTGDVTKALRENHQLRLSNPADCLNKNVSKGHCENDGRQFFVTPDGFKELE